MAKRRCKVKIEGKGIILRSRRRSEDNIKTYIEEVIVG
jgi:hypothetical protein